MNNKFRGIIIRDYLHSHGGTLTFLNSFYKKKLTCNGKYTAMFQINLFVIIFLFECLFHHEKKLRMFGCLFKPG